MNNDVKDFLSGIGLSTPDPEVLEKAEAAAEDYSWMPEHVKKAPDELELTPEQWQQLTGEPLVQTETTTGVLPEPEPEPIRVVPTLRTYAIGEKPSDSDRAERFLHEIRQWLKLRTPQTLTLDWRKKQTSQGFPSGNDYPPGLFQKIVDGARLLLDDDGFLQRWIAFYLRFTRSWGASALGYCIVDKAMQASMTTITEEELTRELSE